MSKPGRVKVKIKIRFHPGPPNQVETCARSLRTQTRSHIHIHIHSMQHSQSQDNLNFIFSTPMSSLVHPPPTAFPPAQPDDPNSPILFKDNINLVQTQISTVRSLALEALNAMCVLSPYPVNRYRGCLPSADEDLSCLFSKGAYQPGSSPTHAAGINVLYSSILNQHSWVISQRVLPH